MNRQEKFDELVERMELPENTARRNPAVLSEADTAIAQNIADMRHYLTVLNDTSKSDICFTEKQFADILFSLILAAVIRQNYDASSVLMLLNKTIY